MKKTILTTLLLVVASAAQAVTRTETGAADQFWPASTTYTTTVSDTGLSAQFSAILDPAGACHYNGMATTQDYQFPSLRVTVTPDPKDVGKPGHKVPPAPMPSIDSNQSHVSLISSLDPQLSSVCSA